MQLRNKKKNPEILCIPVDYIYPQLLNLRTGRQRVQFNNMNIGYLSRSAEEGAPLRATK
jgi:hypothetical protein